MRVLISLLVGAMTFVACQPRAEQEAPVPAAFFVPDGVRNLQQHERQGIRDISYEVDATYPASPFLCELTSHLDQQQWRGLREDALNPGLPSSLVRGWGDYGNATRQPETHVHAWMSPWLNEQGDLLIYALQYEYPEAGTPDLSVLKVSAVMWPASLVRMQLGNRADQLRALVFATGPESPRGDRCRSPQWSDFVRSKSKGAEPVLALSFEFGQVRSIRIQSDIDGLAGRIAARLRAQVPDLRVSTVHDRVSEAPDATLDFRAECRCNEAGAPNGFYVREAVLYKSGVRGRWIEPARVLFHWTDSDEPAWRAQVPAGCLAQQPLSPSCKASFEQADIAFADALASALIDVQRQR